MKAKKTHPHDFRKTATPAQIRALDALCWVLKGEHHLPRSGVRACGPTGVEFTTFQDYATFDFDELTRIVYAGHKFCVRIELSGAAPGFLRVQAYARDVSGKDMFERHPTVQQLIEKLTKYGDSH